MNSYMREEEGHFRSYTVRKEIECNGETEILHELFHDTMRISESHELICVVS